MLIQHTARTYQGQSGGPILIYDPQSQKYKMVGITFRISRLIDRMIATNSTGISAGQFYKDIANSLNKSVI